MKILLVHPGARFSIGDVYNGLSPALKRSGVEVVDYALDGRLDVSVRTLASAYKRFGKANGLPIPSDADQIYHASMGAIERALRHQVDWVLVVTGMYWHPDITTLLGRAGIPTAILLTECPYDDDAQSRIIEHYDYVFANDRASVARLKEHNLNVSYLPMAYDPYVHRPGNVTSSDVPAHDVVFVGTGFSERINLLEEVDWEGIDFGLYGVWNLVGRKSPLRQHIRSHLVRNDLAADLYRKAKIGLQLYRNSVTYVLNPRRVMYGESLSPRALELAATGCFTLSHRRAEVGEIFGDAVPTFETPSELEGLIRYWLPRDDERTTISDQLPQLVAGRSFDDMAQRILLALTGIKERTNGSVSRQARPPLPSGVRI